MITKSVARKLLIEENQIRNAAYANKGELQNPALLNSNKVSREYYVERLLAMKYIIRQSTSTMETLMAIISSDN